MKKNVSRQEFVKHSLSENDLLPNPIQHLGTWWQDAIDADVNTPDAVHLSTVDHAGRPDARIVLLKQFDQNGLVFFTNYESPKAQQLQANPYACMILFWPQLERQVRIRGEVKKTSAQESNLYFASRPRGAQLGAWASPQSQAIGGRKMLEDAYNEAFERFLEQPIPRPLHWGGYRLVPYYFEFWQGRQDRLHDRFCFEQVLDGWHIKRLAP